MPAHFETKYVPAARAMLPGGDVAEFAIQEHTGHHDHVIRVVVGDPANVRLPKTGLFAEPLSWSLTSGTLPPGLEFVDGAIVGTPAARGRSNPVAFRAVDSSTPPKFADAVFAVVVS